MIGTLAVDGWTVKFGTAMRGRGGLRPQAPPRCTKCNSPPINGQCTNFIIIRCCTIIATALKSPVHVGDIVGDNVDRDKLSNSRCCRFVAKTGNKVDRISNKVDRISNKVDRIGDSRLCCRFVAGFSNSRLCRQCVPGLKG